MILYLKIFLNPGSKICDQKECFLYNKFILNINYFEIKIPKILCFNCDFGTYDKLLEYKQKIDMVFKDEIIINKSTYELVGIIFHKNNNHYLSLSKNINCIFNSIKIIGYIMMI